MIKKLKLVFPSKKYLPSWQKYLKNFIVHLPDIDPDKETYKNLLETSFKINYFTKIRNDRLGINLDKGMVPQIVYWAIVDEKVVGRISFRFPASKKLVDTIGHIGYSVAPRYRGKGYASKMLSLLITSIRKRNILKNIVIICKSSNIASQKVIERCGGVLTREGIIDGLLYKTYLVKG